MPAPFRAVVDTWRDVRAASGRLEKRRRMAQLFAGLEPADVRLAATFLAGEPEQGALGVGWAVVSEAVRAAGPRVEPRLLLADVDATFTELTRAEGTGANRRRAELVAALLARADADERELLVGLILGELRQGALRALVLEALADARAVELGELRRAVMHAGSLATVVEAVARAGPLGLEGFQLVPLTPVEPMLAAIGGDDLDAAVVDLGGRAAAEWKLDGVRIQVHRAGDEVRVFTRSLRDVTAGAGSLVATARALPAARFILDGEAIALDAELRPIPFQDLMSELPEGRFDALFFDLLYLDGPLVDRPDRERRAALEALVGPDRCVPRREVASGAEARAVLDEALARGHEGIVLKALDAPYAAGRRGGLWRKVKVAHTLDLVILAAEWGHGRRRGLLSNLHLGARDPVDPERFWMLGKTFKGLTDGMLRELTRDLPPIAVDRTEHVVVVRRERVVEIAFDGLQRSSRYDSGLALRFARVKRFRPDKRAAEATSIAEIRAMMR
jgi:DNA ligase-1